jgi:hypothetical protein
MQQFLHVMRVEFRPPWGASRSVSDPDGEKPDIFGLKTQATKENIIILK